jgi:hypothetical protein
MSPTQQTARSVIIYLMTCHPATMHALRDKPQPGVSPGVPPKSDGFAGRFRRLRHAVARWWLREISRWTR